MTMAKTMKTGSLENMWENGRTNIENPVKKIEEMVKIEQKYK